MAKRWLTRLLTGLMAGVLFTWPAEGAPSLTERFSVHDETSTATVDHAAWTQFLAAYVKASPDGVNRVDYRAVTPEDRAALEAYLQRLQAANVDALSRGEQYAYWVNLYNALTVKVVLDHYPVASIRNIKYGRIIALGPWSEKLIAVAGERLSLDDIEHKILRPVWKDPRTHYAVNCASLGCPNLQTVAFTGDNTQALLDAGARAYVNHPRGVRIDAGGRVRASSIYSWFRKDFGASEAEVLAHFRQYADEPLAAALAGLTDIAGYDYDWSLNGTENTKDARQ